MKLSVCTSALVALPQRAAASVARAGANLLTKPRRQKRRPRAPIDTGHLR